MIPLLILLASAATHLFRLGSPAAVVFDEVYYGHFAADYWHGLYFFDLHPPLVKLLFAAAGLLAGSYRYAADWGGIGNALPIGLLELRSIPALAGMLLPLIVYAICRRLSFSKLASFAAAALLILENSLVVQSRFILPDAVMLAAGFGAILLYLIYIQRRDGRKELGHEPRTHESRAQEALYHDIRGSMLFAGSALLAAAALSIKWTGLTFLCVILAMEGYRLIGATRTRAFEAAAFKRRLKESLSMACYYLAIAATLYIALFAVHFAALPYSGDGDAFMSPSFQKTLIGSAAESDGNIAPEGFAAKFVELNAAMFSASSGMTATHSYSSKWYTWPLMLRPVFYWQAPWTGNEPASAPHAYIYLLGNPFVYWLGSITVAVLTLIGMAGLFFERARLKDVGRRSALFFLIFGYLANLLPFIFIGRVMFLYHYETALVFSVIAIAFLIGFLEKRSGHIAFAATSLMLAAALTAFIYWSPLTYGLPLTGQELQARMWLSSWR